MVSAKHGEADDRRDRLQLFFRQARSAIFAQIAMGLFLLYLASAHLNAEVERLTFGWFSLLLIVSVGRVIIIGVHTPRTLDSNQATPSEILGIETTQARLVGLSGLAWGLVPWFVWQGDHATMDYLAAAMVFGMAGSATATLAALPTAFSWFVWPAVLPYIVKACLIGGVIYYTAAVIMLFGIVALTYFNRTVHRMISEAIRLRREKAELATQLQKEKAAVEEASRIKSLFLAGVSHDLKHPLNALGLYLGYIKLQPEGISRALPGMEQALGNMGDQLSRLLELSRLESGALVVSPRITDVSQLLYSICRGLMPVATQKGLRLKCRIPDKRELETDAKMLQSIVENLLGNAIRYTEQGGVLLALRGSQGTLRIEVWDTGPGIPAEQIEPLFEAYRRFDDTNRNIEKGYGLGLALTRKQCELLGYTVSVQSKLGQGSVFQVHLKSEARL